MILSFLTHDLIGGSIFGKGGLVNFMVGEQSGHPKRDSRRCFDLHQNLIGQGQLISIVSGGEGQVIIPPQQTIVKGHSKIVVILSVKGFPLALNQHFGGRIAVKFHAVVDLTGNLGILLHTSVEKIAFCLPFCEKHPPFIHHAVIFLFQL